MRRNFRRSLLDDKRISANPAFAFAASHAIAIYNRRSIYTYIPKNACSTIRYSVAYDNGFVDSLDDIAWIHNNNETFKASISELSTCEYAFVILRCPFRRLTSAYLNKIANIDLRLIYDERHISAYLQSNSLERFVSKALLKVSDIFDDPVKEYWLRKSLNMTFRDFIISITTRDHSLHNEHWRPQDDFLIYQSYDDYFCLENFDEAVDIIGRKSGLEIVDTRDALKHDTGHYEKEQSDCSRLTAHAINQMMSAGRIPDHAALYTADIIRQVEAYYRKDLELYRARFGKHCLIP